MKKKQQKKSQQYFFYYFATQKHQEVNNTILVVAAATIKTYGQRTDGRQEKEEEDRPCLKQRLYAIMPRGNHG